MTTLRDPFLIAAEMVNPKPKVARLARFMYDPVAFARECIDWKLGEGLTPYQEQILAALPLHGRVSARGPHGLGKSMEAALAVLWFALTRDDAGTDWKCPTTASAWRQLEHYLWPEIHKWARRLRWDVLGRPAFNERTELQALNLKLTHGSAFAVASDTPAFIEGVHADAVLYVFDEAKTIPADTFDAAEGAFSGAGGDTAAEAYALAQSTPGEPNGRFYEIHQRKAGLEDWWVRHVTLEEAIAAGRVSREWAEARERQWGRDTAVFANRVLGEFHSSDEDSVIPLGWIELAQERWRAWDDAGRPGMVAPVRLGVDVAESGGDQTVIALRFAKVVAELRYSSMEDTMSTTGRVSGILGAWRFGDAVVDSDGIGAGVSARLRELGHQVLAFHAARGVTVKDRSGELGFINTRAAAWWNLRELLDPQYEEGIALPPDDMLTGDLTAPKWRIASSGGGRIQIESKDDIRKRLGRSTDSGDAVVQVFWDEPIQPVTQQTYKRTALRGTR